MIKKRQDNETAWREFAPDETATVEILSTQELKAMLDASGDSARGAIEELAASTAQGVIGRDTATGDLGVLTPESLDSLMNEDRPMPRRPRPGERRRPAGFDFATAGSERVAKTVENVRARLESGPDDDELQLVDTQMLRVLLDEDRAAKGKPPKYSVDEPPGGGKNIYDRAEPTRSAFPDEEGGFNPYDSGGRPKR